MPFIDNISQYKSVAIVGLDKNTGKTECLNYVLSRIDAQKHRFAITSIGIDGERRDNVTKTDKPEIELPKDIFFITSEQHYRTRRLFSELIDVDMQHTALGRLVTAKVLTGGKVLLSGPSDTGTLKRFIRQMSDLQVGTTIVDGALSRMSLASPAVTEAMILATGAAVSINIPQLVKRTLYAHKLINTQAVKSDLISKLEPLEQGIFAVDREGEVQDLHIPSVFMLDKAKKDIFKYGNRIYVAGAISDKLLNFFRIQKEPVELIIRDFSKVFASAMSYDTFIKRGCSIKTVYASKLLAVTINPQSPTGYCLDSDTLKYAMQDALQIPVYDVVKEKM